VTVTHTQPHMRVLSDRLEFASPTKSNRAKKQWSAGFRGPKPTIEHACCGAGQVIQTRGPDTADQAHGRSAQDRKHDHPPAGSASPE